MQTSVSISGEETIFGLTWKHIFALRDRLARKYHNQCNQRVPVQELHSAGNQAMAEAIRDYPSIEGHPFIAVVVKRMGQAMSATVRNNTQGWCAPCHAQKELPPEVAGVQGT